MKSLHQLASLGLLAALAPSSGWAVPKEIEINVNVDLTEEGRKLTLPTREHPVYFVSMVGGFKEKGDGLAGDPVPPAAGVLQEMNRMLAKQGYLPASSQTPLPSLLLVLFWGRIHPEIEAFGGNEVFLNRKEMMALVGSRSLRYVDQLSARQAVLQAAEENRYYTVIAAYDYAAAQQKKKVLLWRTKMSTPTNRVDFADVASALIASGEAWLGRENPRPVWVKQSLTPHSSVNLGELQVLEYGPKPAPGEKPH